MNAKKCDKCGKFYDEYSTKSYDAEPNAILLVQNQENKETYCCKQYDLCRECMENLREWFKEGDKINE